MLAKSHSHRMEGIHFAVDTSLIETLEEKHVLASPSSAILSPHTAYCSLVKFCIAAHTNGFRQFLMLFLLRYFHQIQI